MADWLSTGAGGTEGLEQVMEKLFAEHLQQAQLAETTRHNKSTEQNAADNYRLSSADRQDRIAQQLANSKAQQKDRELLAGEKKAEAIPIGASVPDDEAQSMMGSGAVSRGNFDWKPGNMGMSTEKGEVGPTEGGFQWKGTQDAITKAATAAKERASSGPVEETPEGLVRVGPDNQASPVLNDNGDQVKKYHPPPQPDRVLIQTDQGFMPRSKAAGILAGGGTVNPKMSGALEARTKSADAVNSVGADLISELSDPQFAAVVGPVMGRYGSLRDFIGNPPPEYAELAGEIESFSLANMGVHGMRSSHGAQMIANMLNEKGDPASLTAKLKGLMKYSQTFSALNAPKTGGGGAAPPNPNRKRFDLQGNELKPGSDD